MLTISFEKQKSAIEKIDETFYGNLLVIDGLISDEDRKRAAECSWEKMGAGDSMMGRRKWVP